MAINNLMLECFEEEAFYLFAIYSSAPSFKIAFLLNKSLNLKLEKKVEDIEVIKKKKTEIYSYYVYENKENYTTYSLFNNKCILKNKRSIVKNQIDLFAESDNISEVKNLIPEHKKVDFFLKIETQNDMFKTNILVSKIKEIKNVITAFEVDCNSIKSKQNLIIT